MNSKLLCIVLVLVVGCNDPHDVRLPPETPASVVVPNDLFDASRCGDIHGIVEWQGPAPMIQPIVITEFRTGEPIRNRSIPHPNAPQLNSSRIMSAIVRLEGIDPRRAKPMSIVATDVELNSDGVFISAGNSRSRLGWAPVGSELRIVNRKNGIGGIRARGAEFFAHLFPAENLSVNRTLNREGRTTFTSASGQYWAVADLFASLHPYIATTDDNGQFLLSQVPEGEYELILWHPNWHVVKHDLDPETGVISRQTYAQPVEVRTVVRVGPGEKRSVRLSLSEADFAKP